jgi:hypothetical protein
MNLSPRSLYLVPDLGEIRYKRLSLIAGEHL